MQKRWLLLCGVGLVAALGATAQAIPKVGNCPQGYSASGNYCVGGSHAPHAIPKSGNCPAGYRVSGAYCVK